MKLNSKLINYGNQYQYANYSYTYANYLPDDSNKDNYKNENETQQLNTKFNSQKLNKFISRAKNIKNKILKWLD